MDGDRDYWVTENTALWVGVVGFVHLSLVPGPSAGIEPAWIAVPELHIVPYVALSIVFAGYAILNTSPRMTRMKAIPLVSAGILTIGLSILFIDGVTVSREILDSLTVAVPTLLALAVYSVQQGPSFIATPES